MTIDPHFFIDENSLNFCGDDILFEHLKLDEKTIAKHFVHDFAWLSQKISRNYKIPTTISFNGFHKTSSSMMEFLQFDDVCIKLLHVKTGRDIWLILNTKITRSLLIKLLSTTLVDDSHGLLFSSTEKGIFSFILARLLSEIKFEWPDKWPDVKLMGIYHCQDNTINDTSLQSLVLMNYNVNLAHESFIATIALPITLAPRVQQSDTNLVSRLGFLRAPIIFCIKTLRIDENELLQLRLGDLIIFDDSPCLITKSVLHGRLNGVWHNVVVAGTISARDNRYIFEADLADRYEQPKDAFMEETEIIGRNSELPSPSSTTNKLSDLVKNIRVSLSIELSRIPMSLQEICAIKDGEIIDLNRRIDEPLEMVVENKVIGHCQPVRINGRLGIRVINMLDDTAKPQQGSL